MRAQATSMHWAGLRIQNGKCPLDIYICYLRSGVGTNRRSGVGKWVANRRSGVGKLKIQPPKEGWAQPPKEGWFSIFWSL